MRVLRLVLLVSLVCSLVAAQSNVAAMYSSTFSGDGTYYGATNNGACSLRVPSAPSTATNARSGAALNNVQWNRVTPGLACGMCIRINGSGQGSGADPITGVFDVIIDDLCPGCADGDIDLASTGDGRWDIRWYAVDCNPTGNSGNVQYVYQGSNPWYIKVQIRNTRVPVKSARLNNAGTWVTLAPSNDGFWIHDGFSPPLGSDVTIEWTSIRDEVQTDTISGSMQGTNWQNGVVFDGSFQFAGFGTSTFPPSASSTGGTSMTMTMLPLFPLVFFMLVAISAAL